MLDSMTPPPPELLTRAVETVVPRELAEQKLASGKPLRLYLGIDPTGSKLHLGHSVPLRKLKEFQKAGHHVIFLVGSFTAMIGDPTGRDTMREPLTKKQVEENFETYKQQASKILDFSQVELRYNHEWLEPLKPDEFLRIASQFTVQQMMQRDMFKERMQWKVQCVHCGELSNSPMQFSSPEDFETATIEGNSVDCPHCGKRTPCTRDNIFPPANPVTSVEFMYPLMQGYDSVVLDVDCEIGGNDQLFNMLCGRKLQKRFGKREKFVLTTKLIEGTDGRKMSKTYDNCIYLEDSASEMFGKTLSINDDLIASYMECCTGIPMQEIAEAKKAMENGANPKEFKVRLAKEIVTLYHGADAASRAEEEFNRMFQKGGLPEEMPEVNAEKDELLINLLVRTKTVSSKSDAKRLIEQKGIALNDEIVTAMDRKAAKGVVRVGKRKYLKIL